MEFPLKDASRARLCSGCFRDEGLKRDAQRLGLISRRRCPQCGSREGAKLNTRQIWALAHRFFVQGSLHRTEFGGAPVIEFNEHRANEVDFGTPLSSDAELICSAVGIGFFYYGPPLWRLGEVEPLNDLREDSRRALVITRIVRDYPEFELTEDLMLYRLRKGVLAPTEPQNYDSPPMSTAEPAGWTQRICRFFTDHLTSTSVFTSAV